MSELVHAKAITGEYVGTRLETGVEQYLGIRYAKPPRRWKRAEPLDPSNLVISALEDAPACWQSLMPGEFDALPPMSEDCLRLNIWTASTEGSKPVYVFIHGGSYMEGSIRTDCYGGIYCGDGFVRDHPDVVFVNVEYRFGPFGSLDLSTWDEAGEYPDSNNLQILDQLEALRWIKANISAFGGDPDRITVGGQSAGSYSIFVQLALPETRGLYQQAILESSAPGSERIRPMKTPETAAHTAQMMADYLGAKTLEDLLSASPIELNAGTDALFFEPGYAGYDPCADGRLIPKDIHAAWRSGVNGGVKLLSGTTAGEYSDGMIDMTAAEIRAMTERRTPHVPAEDYEAFLANDPEREPKMAMEDMYTDLHIRLRHITATESLIAGGNEAYVYHIAFKPEGNRMRSIHCSELPYVSGKPDCGCYLNVPDELLAGRNPDPVFGKKVQDVWYNFITTGDPNGESLGATWPLYDAERQATMVFDREFHVEDGVRRADLDIARKNA